mgnify:CR=1 FL=1
MGSKRRIADEILPIMLGSSDSKVFVDAFCGGCSVIERVPSSYRRIAIDANRYLIAMWQALQGGARFKEHITRDEYIATRDCLNDNGDSRYSDAEIGFIGFMASRNGIFFNGYTGHDVVGKDGKHRDYIAEYIANIKKDIPMLTGVDFLNYGYDEMPLPPTNSIIYCDPPYKGVRQYRGTGKFNYENFYIWCMEMKLRGYKVFVSEYQMPSEFTCVWEKRITNSLSPNKTVRPVERLFTL